MTSIDRSVNSTAESAPVFQLPASWCEASRTPASATQMATRLCRRYRISTLQPDGSILDRVEIAPAEQTFEAAFAAMGAGCMIATPNGGIAAIDLMPGTVVSTSEGQNARVLWVGSVTIHPTETDQPRLFRVVAGAFGPNMPETDLLLGRGALLALRQTGPLQRLRDLIDGDNVIATRPVSPVSLHQVILDRPGLLKVSGLYLAQGKTEPGTRRFARAEDRRRYADLFAGVGPTGMTLA